MSSSSAKVLYREQLVALYAKHDPAKLVNIDDLLQRFAGHEEALVRTVERKYAQSTQQAVPSSSPPHRGLSPNAPNLHERIAEVAPSPEHSTAAENASYSTSQLAAATEASSLPSGATTENKRAAAGMGSYRARLTRLFEAHAPVRVSRVDHELEKYKGREEELLKAAVARFGPEPPAPPAPVTISAVPPNETSDVSIANAVSPNCSAVLAAPSRDYRSRAVELYLRYDPSKAHKVDAQLSKFSGREEAYLRALEKKLQENSTAGDNKKNSAASTGNASAPPSTTPAALRAATPDSEDTYKQRLTRLYALYAPAKVHHTTRQLQRYPGREEEVIQAAVAKYGPEPTPDGDGPGGAPLERPSADGESPATTKAVGGDGLVGEVAKVTGLTAEAGDAERKDKTMEVAAETRAREEEAAAAAAEARTREEEATAAAAAEARAHQEEAAAAAAEARTREEESAAAAAAEARAHQEEAAAAAAEARAREEEVAVDAEPHSIALTLFPSTAQPSASTPSGKVAAPPSSLVAQPDEPPLDAATAVLKCVSRTPLFGVTLYDFFRVLGTVTVSAKEVVTMRVATTLLRAIDPDPSRLIASRDRDTPSAGAEEFVSEVELRDCVLQFCVGETEKGVQKRQRAVQSVHGAIQRMSDFVKTCRRAVLQQQRQPAPLSAGFWVHRAVQPRVMPRWDRCWAKTSAEGDTLCICVPGSAKPQMRIPFSRVVQCFRDGHAAGAPPAYARNGLVFQLTTGNPPLQVVVCPEGSDVGDRLLAGVRAWSGAQSPSRRGSDADLPTVLSATSPSKLHSRVTDAASSSSRVSQTMRVWSVAKGTSTYERQSWEVTDDSLRMTSLPSQQVTTCATAEITTIMAETEPPVPLPVRTACGFMLCLRSGSSIMAFTEHPQERARVLERLSQSRLLLQFDAAS
ncbi:hypothetical protein ABB37_08681 [Leptomonas pyrrhocoris]|uniref:Uncharacterized protein n=1 Tax=Leptomonas pyrrhocoris TaxID=157538 RepID=A0A0N0DS46_LEPPY|nr:hypothetical protein ABB37_08681 [Leptomonas pyrrhocoris]KPA75411.1 hypothetical protein ABB37_08681 [Leptomonas pyrrhocoris]|eukprot:XP_015653850.1 hypothetical protein ABB37_08681 [Leptomonas pyrrhocoris]